MRRFSAPLLFKARAPRSSEDSPEGEFSDPRRPCLAEQLDEAGQLNYRNARRPDFNESGRSRIGDVRIYIWRGFVYMVYIYT